MVKYSVRSRQLVDIVNDIKDKKLVISPYFQRKMVWRTIHKMDFIDTILLGLPFPEIFIAKGDLDIDKMANTSCIVDGQQRLGSILEFIDGGFKVQDKSYQELSVDDKESFLKYEIAIIELDIKHDDSRIMEIFKRVNRTYYSLSNIEKISSEFSPSEFMLVAKLLANELDDLANVKDCFKEELDYDLEHDPLIPREFMTWAEKQSVNNINKLIVNSNIFTSQELSRQVHLNFVLNLLGTISLGFFNRNLKKEKLEEYADEFPNKDFIVRLMEKVCAKIIKINFRKKSYWYNKANIFSIIIAFYNNFEKIEHISEKDLKTAFEKFEKNLPIEFALSAKEGVNNKKERLIRDRYIVELINEISSL